MTQARELTDRDLELIEVALESAINACGGSSDDMVNLRAEYAHALYTIRTMGSLG